MDVQDRRLGECRLGEQCASGLQARRCTLELYWAAFGLEKVRVAIALCEEICAAADVLIWQKWTSTHVVKVVYRGISRE